MHPAATSPALRWWRAAAIAMAVIVVGVSGWTIWSGRSWEPQPATHLQFDLGLGEGQLTGAVAISADGKALAVGRSGPENSRRELYVRHFDRLDAQSLPGTADAESPMFSPDGQWIAFFADGALRKVPTAGGAVVTMAAVAAQRGGWWAADDTIVFATTEGLSRISAAGGSAELFARTTPGQPPPTTPQVLPGNRGVIYGQAVSSDPTIGTVYVQDFAGGSPKEILQGGRLPRYVASGHLTFVRGGTLHAVPFDLDALATNGEAIPVTEGVYQVALNAAPNLAVSANGVLVYQPGSAGFARQQASVMWLTANAPLSPLRATATAFAFPRFSPDGRRLALAITDSRQSDIWVYDWERDT